MNNVNNTIRNFVDLIAPFTFQPLERVVDWLFSRSVFEDNRVQHYAPEVATDELQAKAVTKINAKSIALKQVAKHSNAQKQYQKQRAS